MKRIFALAILLLAIHVPQAHADNEGSGGSTSLQSVGFVDLVEGSGSLSTSVTSGGHDYDYAPACGIGGTAVCFQNSECVVDDVEGLTYDITRDGELVGQTCVTAADPEDEATVTPGQVLQAFRRLKWPASTLIVEPPGGETLVNFPTNFHTDNDVPSRQVVTLLGRRIVIEATPTTYTWRFGDGGSLDTETAGAAYPSLDITHEYRTAESFAPSVDTTYTGRYRIGHGPWVAIPETLTVAGASQALTAREARPTLVQP